MGVIGSDNEVLSLSLPTAWESLTDEQMRMVYHCFARGLSSPETKALCLLKWNRLTVIARTGSHKYMVRAKSHGKTPLIITPKQIQAATVSLDFIDSLPQRPVRLDRIGGAEALQADFEGVPFRTWLFCENLFQGYLQNAENKEVATSILRQMAGLLYPGCKNPDEAELVNVFYWFAALKQYFSEMFPHFFMPADEVPEDNLLGQQSLYNRLREATNAQIRALTGGDITKENQIMDMDTHRALTELDAKAREAEEYRKMAKK